MRTRIRFAAAISGLIVLWTSQPAAGETYNWQAGPWSACTKVCGDGFESGGGGEWSGIQPAPEP